MILGVVEPSAELDDLAHRVIGAAIEAHRLLGPGFLESVYEEALCVELALHDIPFARQVRPVSINVPVGASLGGASAAACAQLEPNRRHARAHASPRPRWAFLRARNGGARR